MKSLLFFLLIAALIVFISIFFSSCGFLANIDGGHALLRGNPYRAQITGRGWYYQRDQQRRPRSSKKY